MGDDGGGRSSGSTRELQMLRRQAMKYYQENQVPRRLEELLNSTFYLQPADVYGHLANCMSELAIPPTICQVVGKNVLDGLGLPTLQVEIFCTIRNFPKSVCSVVVATHFQVHENAPSEQLEVEEMERFEEVSTALQWVNEELSEQLQGQEPCDQAEVDQLLRTFFEKKVQEDKERKDLEKKISAMPIASASPPSPPAAARKKGQKAGKREMLVEKPVTPAEPTEPVLCGSMAISATSLAIARTRAVLASTPLYLSIALLKHNEGVAMILEIQKNVNRTEMLPSPKTESKKGYNGGKRSQPHLSSRMSHLGCLTVGYDTLEQPLQLIQGICANLGLELGANLHLAINCAAQELMDYSKGKYEVMAGVYKSAAEMVDLYVDLINKFPSIIALIDPFRKEDSEQWDSVCTILGSRCHIIAGAESKSISRLLEDGTISNPKSSGLIIRHTNQTTVSDLVAITDLTDSQKLITVFGSSEAETCDDGLVDLATGLGVRFVKLGGLSRGERVAKYNAFLLLRKSSASMEHWEDLQSLQGPITLQISHRTNSCLEASERTLVTCAQLLAGFKEDHTFLDLHEEAEEDADMSETAALAGELGEDQHIIFPTEVSELTG